MTPGIYQRGDGTVYWLHEDGRWQYLSPLFGEWLDVFDQPDNGQLDKYPRNLATWRSGGISPSISSQDPLLADIAKLRKALLEATERLEAWGPSPADAFYVRDFRKLLAATAPKTKP